MTLSALRGGPVILHFNKGAGCDSCNLQTAEIEKEPGFAEAGITVLPVVMNTAQQINLERARFGVEAPFLLDDGCCLLIDADGVQQWYGNFPSMWLAPQDLLEEALSRL